MLKKRLVSDSFCEDRRDDIVLYIFSEMGPGGVEAFESHLASCAGCRSEVESLRRTLEIIGEGTRSEAMGALDGDSLSWESEWTLLRRRLLSGESFGAEIIPFAARATARTWVLRAAAIVLTAGLAFTAGYMWRGGRALVSGAPRTEQPYVAAPISGATADNYFDALEDFSRDTHNFLRRSRMLLMEFANLSEDSDPTFFRQSSTDLLAELGRYRQVAQRMPSRKLVDLLDQIGGVLKVISQVDTSNERNLIREVRATLDLTGLVAALEILEANIERDLRGQSHV